LYSPDRLVQIQYHKTSIHLNTEVSYHNSFPNNKPHPESYILPIFGKRCLHYNNKMKRIQSWLKKLFFNWAYLNQPPWDSGITPPELTSFVENHPSGAAIDLGCGTGTNVLYLARHGWQVDGIDFSWLAIIQARRRLRNTKVSANLLKGDVTQLQKYPLRSPFNLAVDIGCMHALGRLEAAQNYANGLITLLKPGGHYLLYAHQAEDDGDSYPQHGLTLQWAEFLFSPALELMDYQPGTERSMGSAWYFYKKTS
jgi:SAM-dependent methyltransferase